MQESYIDIIIPVYNSYETIEKTIDSILKQEHLELINVYIIDDNSDKDYLYLKDKYNNINLTISKLKSNSGPGVARNKGIEISHGEYIYFLDSDDELVSPTAIYDLSKLLDTSDLAVGITLNEDSNGNIISYSDDDFNIHGKMYKRSYLDKYNIRFPNIYRHEDRTFHQIVLASNPIKSYLNEEVYYYHFNNKSLTRKDGLDIEIESLKDLFIGMKYLIDVSLNNNFQLLYMEYYLFYAIVYAYSLYNISNNENIIKWSKETIDTYKEYEDYLNQEDKNNIYNFITSGYNLKSNYTLNQFLNKKDMNILISINNKYIDQAKIMLRSLKLNTNSNINIYLIYSDISDDNINIFKEFVENEIGNINIIKFDEDINLPINIDHITKETYYRLFAPYIIDVDRILYLDCDLIINGSIDAFYNSNLDNNIIGAINNFDSDSYLYNERLGLAKDNNYINAGVLLIDVKKYKKYITKEEIIKYINNNLDILDYQDQDVINYLFHDNIKIYDYKYNYQITQILDGYEEYGMNIVHYCNKYKPWNDDFINFKKAYDYYNLLDKLQLYDFKNELLNKHIKTYENNNYSLDGYNVLLSIIVPIYNSSNYLEKCLDSIKNQYLNNIEVLLLDDGSTDNSIDICNKYINIDSRFKLIKNNHVGVSEIRNIGVKEAKGKYITFVDSDDYINQDIYIKALDYMYNNKLKMVIYNFTFEYEDGSIIYRNEFNNNEIIKNDDMIIEVLKDDKIMNFMWSKVIESSILKEIRFPNNRTYEDIAVSIPIIERMNEFGYIGENLYHYFRRSNSITTTYSYNNIKDGMDLTYEQFKYINDKYPKYNIYNLYNMIKRICDLYFNNYDYLNKELFFKDYSSIITDILKLYDKNKNELLKIFDNDLNIIRNEYNQYK